MNITENEIACAALLWYLDHGVDVPMGEDIYVPPVSKDKAAVAAPITSPSQQSDEALLSREGDARSVAQQSVPAAPLPFIVSPDEAVKAASKAQTLAELSAAITAFDAHPLKRHATHMVFGQGHTNARVMVMGDAPGDMDDQTGQPFMGEEGAMLDKMLMAIGLSRHADTRDQAFYAAPLVNWRPPGNRSLLPSEIALSLPFAHRHIALVKPDFLIVVGAVATKALLGTDTGITRIHGKMMTYTSPLPDGFSVPAMPLYHPGFLMKTPTKKREAWDDLQTFEKLLDGGGAD